jgi:hypothetical protein
MRPADHRGRGQDHRLRNVLIPAARSRWGMRFEYLDTLRLGCPDRVPTSRQGSRDEGPRSMRTPVGSQGEGDAVDLASWPRGSETRSPSTRSPVDRRRDSRRRGRRAEAPRPSAPWGTRHPSGRHRPPPKSCTGPGDPRDEVFPCTHSQAMCCPRGPKVPSSRGILIAAIGRGGFEADGASTSRSTGGRGLQGHGGAPRHQGAGHLPMRWEDERGAIVQEPRGEDL